MSPTEPLDATHRPRQSPGPATDGAGDPEGSSSGNPIRVSVLTSGMVPVLIALIGGAVVLLSRHGPDGFRGKDPEPLSHSGLGGSLAFAPDGRTLAVATGDGMITLWDVREGLRRNVLTDPEARPHFYRSLAYAPDGRTLAMGDEHGTVTVWDLDRGEARARHKTDAGPIRVVACSPDGATLAATCDEGVRLWEMPTGRQGVVLQGASGRMNGVAFAPDSRTLAVGGADHAVRVWDVTTGRVCAVLRGHTSPVNSVSYSPDGETLATADSGPDGTVRLWDVRAGRLRAGFFAHPRPITALGFLPDGTALVTTSADATVKLWDTAAGRLLVTLSGHGQAVTSLAVPLRGGVVATGGIDGTIRLWDVDTGTGKAGPGLSLRR